MSLEFKSFPMVLEDLVAYVVANTPLTDINAGSVLLTLLEAVANEDYQQYLTMVDVIKVFNLDTTTGDDLDERALEYGLERADPTKTSGHVTVTDSVITKISTKFFSGQPGPISGQTYVYVEDATGFSDGDTIIIGRDTNNVENRVIDPVGGITAVGSYYQFTLTVGVGNNHGTEESIILSQGGLRTVSAGTSCYVPETDVNPQLNYSVREDAFMLDGEDEIEDIIVDAEETGSIYNVPVGAITMFSSPPFLNAEVENEESFTNGKDIESDQTLRGRIKNHIQSLSRATKTSVLSQISGVTSVDQQATVISTSFIEATQLDKPSYLYVDDGTGLEPTYSGIGSENIIDEATGGERYFQLDNYPLVKASLISRSAEPYNLVAQNNLKIVINDAEEEISFLATQFSNMSAATAEEVAAAISELSDLAEARTTGGRRYIVVQARDVTNEKIEIQAASATDANDALNFVEDEPIYTLNLYLNEALLSKDGDTAWVESGVAGPTYTFPVNNMPLDIIVDQAATQQVVFVWPGAGTYTATQVIDMINSQLAGAFAEVTVTGVIRITSHNTNSSDSRIWITGGSANTLVLQFPTAADTGQDANYYLNRYNGQIKLVEPLDAYDRLTAGTAYTRAWLRCLSPGPYSVTAGNTMDVQVDGGATQTHNFAAPLTQSAAALATTLNATGDLNGCTFFAYTIGADTYLSVRTNTWDETTGFILIPATAGLDPALTFTTDTLYSNQAPSSAYVESANSETYSFGRDQTLMVILDNDAVNRSFNVSMHQAGTVSVTAPPLAANTVRGSSFNSMYPTDSVFVGCHLQFDESSTTVALRNIIRPIIGYDGTLGDILLDVAWGALPAVPAIGDTFKIMPRTAKNCANLMSNPNFTTLGIFAEIESVDDDTKVQISATEPGSEKSVQIAGGTGNSISIPFATDGTVTGTCTASSIDGLSVGLYVNVVDDDTVATPCYISNIVGGGPYTVTFDDTYPFTAATDISAYTTTSSARIVDYNQFSFLSGMYSGLDGYKFYTGLIREVQRTLDGWDEDLDTYPGYKAAGVQIEVAYPVIKPCRINVNITTDSGTSLSSVSNSVKATISTYINALGVGDDLILTELTYRLQGITGVWDIEYLLPTSNTAVSDNQLLRIREEDIVVG